LKNTSALHKDQERRLALLFIIRYKNFIPGFLSMALFRIPLWFNNHVTFWRLMGSGKNGTFDIVPDLKQWSILVVIPESFLSGRWKIITLEKLIRRCLGDTIGDLISMWNGKVQAILLEPQEGHGLWNGQEVFGALPKSGTGWQGPIAVLTRATIRLSKAKSFWKHVDSVASQMATAEGFVTSYGIGEIPFIKQATFSVWQSKQSMQDFAYKLPKHKEVVRKTHQQKWYSEDMFVRFRLLKVWNLPGLEAVVAASTAASSDLSGE
jgi:heme-degrading monooxygenase HmoA